MNARADLGPAQHMEAVARDLLGEPNKALSTPKELRYGERGSLSIDLKNGVWYDHEGGQGGGVIDLICRQTGAAGLGAHEWLRDRGYIAEVDRESNRRIAATYSYRDETGDLLFEVVRFEPKDFRQRRPDGAGGWVWKLGDCRRVLYRLPELLAAPADAPVFIVEGERDADRLAALGCVATTNPQGARKWRDEFAAPLIGRRAVIIPDADEPGEKHGEAVLASLRKAGVAAAMLRLDGLPPKGDVSDWLAAGGDCEGLLRRAKDALRDGEPKPMFTPASDFAGRAVPPRRWLVKGLIPMDTVTLLGGDGGTGKSLLALQLAIAAATGGAWLGHDLDETGAALFLSAEDDTGELHRRLDDVGRVEGLAWGDLAALQVLSLAGEDALLATLTPGGKLAETPLFKALDAAIDQAKPVMIVLDTLADLFPGNENDRAQARQFIGMLRGLAIRHECAVVLLSHPSLSGLNNGSGTSGSTGWNNSVRSRLYLERIVEKGDGRDYEPDPDRRILRGMKANYGRRGAEITMTWQAGRFVADNVETPLDKRSSTERGERVFLKLLDVMTSQGRYVSASPGPTYAPTQFASHSGAEGCTKRAFKHAMDALFDRGVIANTTHGNGAKARSHIARAEGDHGDK